MRYWIITVILLTTCASVFAQCDSASRNLFTCNYTCQNVKEMYNVNDIVTFQFTIQIKVNHDEYKPGRQYYLFLPTAENPGSGDCEDGNVEFVSCSVNKSYVILTDENNMIQGSVTYRVLRRYTGPTFRIRGFRTVPRRGEYDFQIIKSGAGLIFYDTYYDYSQTLHFDCNPALIPQHLNLDAPPVYETDRYDTPIYHVDPNQFNGTWRILGGSTIKIYFTQGTVLPELDSGHIWFEPANLGTVLNVTNDPVHPYITVHVRDYDYDSSNTGSIHYSEDPLIQLPIELINSYSINGRVRYHERIRADVDNGSPLESSMKPTNGIAYLWDQDQIDAHQPNVQFLAYAYINNGQFSFPNVTIRRPCIQIAAETDTLTTIEYDSYYGHNVRKKSAGLVLYHPEF